MSAGAVVLDLGENPWTSLIDELARCDEKLLDAVVGELPVVARKLDRRVAHWHHDPVTFADHLGESDRDYLLQQGVQRALATDEVLLREGDPPTHVQLIIAGCVRVSTVLIDGREVVLALRGPGDVLGEMAALRHGERAASVRSIGPTSFVQWTSERFLACLHARPGIAIALAKAIADRLRDAEAVRVGAASLDVSRRVARYLFELARDRGKPVAGGIAVDVPLSQEDIAAHLGVSRRAVVRAITMLRERNVITTRRMSVVVHSLDFLQNLGRL
jgi:CRP-like cAMP-binding protein